MKISSAKHSQPVSEGPYDERLQQMIADGRLLQSFAVRSAQRMPEGLHSTFAQAMTKLSDRLRTLDAVAPASETLPALQNDLVPGYDRLATALWPVTAESIRHTLVAIGHASFIPP